MAFLEKIFGNYSQKEVKRIEPIKRKVLELENKYEAMTDKELQSQTPILKERLAKGETLDDILPDAFAVCREAAWRVLGMKHFPVQVVGGIILHQGRIPRGNLARLLKRSYRQRRSHCNGKRLPRSP